MSNAAPPGELITAVPAANADDIGTQQLPPSIEATGGWDAYDVWRRFIKEAREQRRNAAGSHLDSGSD